MPDGPGGGAQLNGGSSSALALATNGAITITPGSTQTALVNAGVGLGYGVGTGGSVTQATSKSTGVTLNKAAGQITMNNAALAATTSVAFTLTNSAIGANDTVVVSLASGNTANSYTVSVDAVAAGSCSISLRNYSAGSLGEAVVLNFAVIKGATT